MNYWLILFHIYMYEINIIKDIYNINSQLCFNKLVIVLVDTFLYHYF